MWNLGSRTVDIDMERAFETQMMGMMQLAGMMMAGLGSAMGNEMSEEEFFSQQQYYRDPNGSSQDYAPIPQQPSSSFSPSHSRREEPRQSRQEQPSQQPITAPHL